MDSLIVFIGSENVLDKCASRGKNTQITHKKGRILEMVRCLVYDTKIQVRKAKPDQWNYIWLEKGTEEFYWVKKVKRKLTEIWKEKIECSHKLHINLVWYILSSAFTLNPGAGDVAQSLFAYHA